MYDVICNTCWSFYVRLPKGGLFEWYNMRYDDESGGDSASGGDGA